MAMSAETITRLNRTDDVQDVIKYAARYHEIDLSPSDFGREDDYLTLDGMASGDWLDAMTMD